MENQEITPEMIEKSRNAKSVNELEGIAQNAGLNYSKEQITHFANQLGIFENGEVSDDALDNIAGGRSTVNGREVECADARVCKVIGLEYDPSWERSTNDDGTEIWQVPYNIFEKALNKSVKKTGK